MSFGFPTILAEGYASLEQALKSAYADDVLLFAAASNDGGRSGRSYPARERTVIAVHTTDTYGTRSTFSPTAIDDSSNIATVGEAVESAWPMPKCHGKTDTQYTVHKSGTSFATPTVAGIAGFLLLYTRMHLPEHAKALKSHKRMEALLKKVAEKGHSGGSRSIRDGYHFVDLSLHPDCLFGKEESYINAIIKDVLLN